MLLSCKMWKLLLLIVSAFSAAVDCIKVDSLSKAILKKMVNEIPEAISTGHFKDVPDFYYSNLKFGVDVDFKSGQVSTLDDIILTASSSTSFDGVGFYIHVPLEIRRLVVNHQVTCTMHCSSMGASREHNVTFDAAALLKINLKVSGGIFEEKCIFEAVVLQLTHLDNFQISSADPHSTSSDSCDYYLPHPVTSEIESHYRSHVQPSLETFFTFLANKVFTKNNFCPF